MRPVSADPSPADKEVQKLNNTAVVGHEQPSASRNGKDSEMYEKRGTVQTFVGSCRLSRRKSGRTGVSLSKLNKERNCKSTSGSPSAPAVGSMIEVLWILTQPGDTNDDKWGPSVLKVRSARCGKSIRRVWWPAKVLKWNCRSSFDLVYTRSPDSCDPEDLDTYVYHRVVFLHQDKIRHGPGRHTGMCAKWRQCFWDPTDSCDDPSDIEVRSGTDIQNIRTHSEYRASSLQLLRRVQELETKSSAIIRMVSGAAALDPSYSVTIRNRVALDRIMTMIRTYIYMDMKRAGNCHGSKRHKRDPEVPITLEFTRRTQHRRSREVDCTLSEFVLLSEDIVRRCQVGVSCVPSTFKCSFLNMRSGDRLRIVFSSFDVLCTALKMERPVREDLFFQIVRDHMDRVSEVQMVGFLISAMSETVSEDSVMIGVGSTLLRSAKESESVSVLHRPISRWNPREVTFEAEYVLKKDTVSNIRKMYCACFNAKGSTVAFPHESDLVGRRHGVQSLASVDVLNGYSDFEICLEWKRKASHIQKAYMSSATTEDVLGTVSCSVPCVLFRSSKLCQNICDVVAESIDLTSALRESA